MTRVAPVFVKCDTCKRLSEHPASTIANARALAKLSGWTLSGDEDTCPDCRPTATKERETERWRNIAVLFLREMNLTYRQIGELMGISRQRVHQICEKPPNDAVADWLAHSRAVLMADLEEKPVEEMSTQDART